MTFARMECLMLLDCTALVFGQVRKSTPPISVEEVFNRSVDGSERATLALAEKMPDCRYNFVPTRGEFKGVRTFAKLATHIAVANYQMGAALLRETVPIEPGPHNNGPDSLRSKADVVQFLRESFVYLHKAMATVNEHNLMGVVELPGGGRAPRLSIVTAAIAHPWDIYGQMIEYLRMNGIDPERS
ncbi:MAG: DinB family protein [Acidobacteriia bacterium]|nr:DinB family protein [Terriglobia bacterium]